MAEGKARQSLWVWCSFPGTHILYVNARLLGLLFVVPNARGTEAHQYGYLFGIGHPIDSHALLYSTIYTDGQCVSYSTLYTLLLLVRYLPSSGAQYSSVLARLMAVT